MPVLTTALLMVSLNLSARICALIKDTSCAALT
jgi:hypothetical protein